MICVQAICYPAVQQQKSRENFSVIGSKLTKHCPFITHMYVHDTRLCTLLIPLNLIMDVKSQETLSHICRLHFTNGSNVTPRNYLLYFSIRKEKEKKSREREQNKKKIFSVNSFYKMIWKRKYKYPLNFIFSSVIVEGMWNTKKTNEKALLSCAHIVFHPFNRNRLFFIRHPIFFF